MPPHNGHRFLIDYSYFVCDKLTIFLCSLPDEPIPGHNRLKWLQELYPQCNIVHFTEAIPEASRSNPEAHTIWAQYIQRSTPHVDFVFASENYGNNLAQALNARFISVDVSRSNIPISGSQIRQNPLQHWSYLPAPVREYYACKIGVVCSSPQQIRIVHAAAIQLQTIAVDAQKDCRHSKAVLYAAARQCNRFVFLVITHSHLSKDTAFFHTELNSIITLDDESTVAQLCERIHSQYPIDNP